MMPVWLALVLGACFSKKKTTIVGLLCLTKKNGCGLRTSQRTWCL